MFFSSSYIFYIVYIRFLDFLLFSLQNYSFFSYWQSFYDVFLLFYLFSIFFWIFEQKILEIKDCIEYFSNNEYVVKNTFDNNMFYGFEEEDNLFICPLRKANKRGTSGWKWKQAYQARFVPLNQFPSNSQITYPS